MQDRTIQYNTVQIQYNITHITQNNIQHSKQLKATLYIQNYKKSRTRILHY